MFVITGFHQQIPRAAIQCRVSVERDGRVGKTCSIESSRMMMHFGHFCKNVIVFVVCYVQYFETTLYFVPVIVGSNILCMQTGWYFSYSFGTSLCNYRMLHNTTTSELVWQYSLTPLLTNSRAEMWPNGVRGLAWSEKWLIRFFSSSSPVKTVSHITYTVLAGT